MTRDLVPHAWQKQEATRKGLILLLAEMPKNPIEAKRITNGVYSKRKAIDKNSQATRLNDIMKRCGDRMSETQRAEIAITVSTITNSEQVPWTWEDEGMFEGEGEETKADTTNNNNNNSNTIPHFPPSHPI